MLKCYWHNISVYFKYPEWLNSNKESLPPEEFNRYEQQHKIMGDICSQFEKDGDQESAFENILELMQKVIDSINNFTQLPSKIS